MDETRGATLSLNPGWNLDLRVETPENVVLNYHLAGPSVRAAAYAVDTLLRAAILFLILVCSGLGQVAGLQGLSAGGFLVALFLIDWWYFAISEGLFNGRSLGKSALGLRVIHRRGHPITFWAAVVRNLMRGVEAFPFYGPAFLSMLLSRNLERMGDLVAETVVIQERRMRAPREPVILEKIQPLPRDEINRYQPDETLLSLIDEFLGRRHVLTHERGHALAAVLAPTLAERLQYRGDRRQVDSYPMAFLARVHVTFSKRRPEELAVPARRRELPERRRELPERRRMASDVERVDE